MTGGETNPEAASPSSRSVGYIGLGRMGGPMARNLVARGFRTIVHDATPAAATSQLAAGAVWAQNPAEVAREAEVVFTCLPGPKQVEAVVHGPDGLLAGAGPGKIFVECTTSDPDQARDLGQRYKAAGADFIEACVSGGPPNSEAGTLVLMLGGEDDAIARARPMLETVGSQLHHMGPVGSGTIAKLVHNLIHNAILQVAIEAISIGMKAGLSSKSLLAIISEGAVGQGAMSKWQLPPMIHGGELGQKFFPIWMSAKDVGLALGLARDIGTSCPITSIVEQNFTEALARGLGDMDNRALAQMIAARSGLPNGLLDQSVPQQ